MAATDKTYRPQKTLDIVFAVSCVLMLLSIFWMFEQDYNRDFKKVQREFRDVETALSERSMLEKLPEVQNVVAAADRVTEARKSLKAIKDANASKLRSDYAEKAKAEANYQGIKANYDSERSLYDIDVDDRDQAASPGVAATAQAAARKRQGQVDKLANDLQAAQDALDKINGKLKGELATQDAAEKELGKAEEELKGIAGKFDLAAKITAEKTWKIGDSIRNLPVIDGFASPTRIQQYTLAEYPIDYSFKYVTRYDRCTTCHLGIDRPAFERSTLQHLVEDPAGEALQEKLKTARDLLLDRASNDRKLGLDPKETLGFDPNNIPKTVRGVSMTPGQISQFCAHPRLDLFVEENSPHHSEKFGCTSCHAGQGSATEFVLAAHTPNTADQQKEWIQKKGWEESHNWDYPMLSKRFIESTCLKCHHQVTDLVRYGSKLEAPKLIRGYNLVRESGCFGCHDISGLKNGKEVGPDLRLEMSPSLEDYSPGERAKIMADTENPPGMMRKVGPSLYRITEKTNQQWVRRWIDSPRGFRPTTKMPHFYGLSNNSPDVLPADQKEFPNAEIHSISHYLFRESNDYLNNSDRYRGALKDQIKNLEEKKKTGLMSDSEGKLLEELIHRLGKDAKPLTKIHDTESDKEDDLPPVPQDQKGKDDQITRGRKLFTERGCLACHHHESAPVPGDANFAPDLSRVAAKIAPERGDNPHKALLWLTQWVFDPKNHHPRTRMPVTHLTVQEAEDVASWLLSQPANGWDMNQDLPAPSSQALANLAKVYLLKAPGMTRLEAEAILAPGEAGKRRGITDIESVAKDADERELAGPLDDNKLKWYIGRKAINRLGCFGCHEIPGFAASKPIGTQLNDWGKKDPERLAFEDVVAFANQHYRPVEHMTDEAGHGIAAENGKPAYEEYFLDALEHHQRDGFLHQKLSEPRSYDFNRERAWDDRLRMPQFKFARGHGKPKEGESQEQFEAREEAEAREAVMTFVLGLVAEPVPAKYLYDPSPDKLAEIKGRQVLEKYNCIGCHQVRPAVYELAKTPALIKKLEELHDNAINSQAYKGDYHTRDFLEHNAWTGVASPLPDRLVLYGLPAPLQDLAPGNIYVRLTQALQFKDSAQKQRDIPAGESIELAKVDVIPSPSPSETFGGDFTNLIVRSKYLDQADPLKYHTDANGENADARAALPPPLLREGEKTQPGWLFQFLRHPFLIRPMTVLRMPRFNMSDEEAMDLVNYFNAADRINNPGIGLSYPYPPPPAQKLEGFWQDHTHAYFNVLKQQNLVQKREAEFKPLWDALLAEEKVRATPKPKNEQALQQDWQNREAYAVDAYRLLASNDRCLNCHPVGPLPPKQDIGPRLDLATERLRPEWLLRWIGSPQRMLIYPAGNNPMPGNFNNSGQQPVWPDFAGTMFDQVVAVRDALVDYPRVSAIPMNRVYRPATGGK
jgi:mono/diheme cytochrome c family protein